MGGLHERRVIIESHFMPKQDLADPIIIAALDRLTHRCNIIETKGESYRLKDAKRRAGTTRKKSA